MNVRKIYHPAPPPKRKRVAAYARVSTGKDAMLHSLSAQISYYSDYIAKHPDWEYAGVFADEAYTGTKENRPGFQEMLSKCKAGEIQMILTKSISRFARNTVTVLQSVRMLKDLEVDIFFEEQNIHSLSSEGELMLTILSSYAQEESRSASENVKWRVRKDFKEGKVSGMSMFGYHLVDGVLTVIPEEAEVVKAIYADYMSGMGILAIVKKYKKQGLNMSRSGINGLLRNEKYFGSMVLQKTFVNNHIEKKKVINRGQLPKYFVSDSHEAIIPKDEWDAVQEEIKRRAEKYLNKSNPKQLYPYSSLIRCGKCGANYKRKHTAAGMKYEKIVWICSTFDTLGKSECGSQQIPETILDGLVSELGGIDKIYEITVPEANRLTFKLKDGSVAERTWQNPSRRDSWTPEMREAARQKALLRNREKVNQE
ncbi:MAG: recombinase family protein [Oscillospiraceae bacterium]|jgi:DNA invertase Pin-like site-specific DNA recombinase|nr:recombinase family protein [Oscillospiraceae bacterium]